MVKRKGFGIGKVKYIRILAGIRTPVLNDIRWHISFVLPSVKRCGSVADQWACIIFCSSGLWLLACGVDPYTTTVFVVLLYYCTWSAVAVSTRHCARWNRYINMTLKPRKSKDRQKNDGEIFWTRATPRRPERKARSCRRRSKDVALYIWCSNVNS